MSTGKRLVDLQGGGYLSEDQRNKDSPIWVEGVGRKSRALSLG